MNKPQDVLGRDLLVGARVGVAFSYSQASVGHIRIGTIEELKAVPNKYNPNGFEITVRIRWEADNVLSPKLKYGNANRWILL